jgi:zinc D-Ala-D-Ala carboxypeptidase
VTLLTTHFTLEEFVLSEYAQRKDLDNTPSPGAAANLLITAGGMEKVRSILGNRPIHITSGYRSPMVNAGLGGVPTSAHCVGYAADFICPFYGSNYVVAKTISETLPVMKFDQLILEYGWIHISFAPTMRGELLTKKNAEAPYEIGLIP